MDPCARRLYAVWRGRRGGQAGGVARTSGVLEACVAKCNQIHFSTAHQPTGVPANDESRLLLTTARYLQANESITESGPSPHVSFVLHFLPAAVLGQEC